MYKNIKGIRVLVVDDNDINQEITKGLLEPEGVLIDLASNGEEACRMIRRANYDAILMDIHMPVMDGYTATKIIRKWEDMDNKALKLRIKKRIPIIAVTASALKGESNKCFEAGMDEYITKPIEPEILFSALNRFIQKVNFNNKDKTMEEKEITDIPDNLDGINVKDALESIQGNQVLLKKLFKIFFNNFENAAKEIKDAINQNNLELAHRLSHTIKGSAASLGAINLRNTALFLENALRENKLQYIESLLHSFEKELKIVLKSIESISNKL
ncbi:MAG: response regulator [Desulfobacterales bacterium]|nr:response regulator [Desulfobacterales bacterium]